MTISKCLNKDYVCGHRADNGECEGNVHCVYCEDELMIKQTIDDEYKNGHHSSYYGGKDDPYEPVKVLGAWSKKNNWNGEQGFYYGMALKYINRAGEKDGNSEAQDIQKGINYLQMWLDLIK